MDMTYPLHVAGIVRDLPICRVTDDLYIGAFVVFGGWMLLVEWFMNITFPEIRYIGWSLYPMITLVVLGGYLIFLGIYAPARETMERKFFI